jgi:hypothetical protein
LSDSRIREISAFASPTWPRWPSFSGLTIERIAWIWPVAISRVRTPISLPVGIEELGPGLTVHVHAATLDAGANRDPPPVAKHLGDLDPAEGGALDRGSEPAPIAVQLDVLREQSLERLELAVLGGGKEALGEPLSKLGRGLEPEPALLDVPAGAGGELAGVALARPDDLRDLVVAVVEDVV